MNQAQLKGNWQQLKGKVHQKWGKLTDDDLQESQGDSELLIGKITERYGISKEKAIKKLDKYLTRFDQAGNDTTTITTRVSDLADTLNTKVYSAAKQGQKFAQDKPMATLGIAAVIGILLGLFMSRSKS